MNHSEQSKATMRRVIIINLATLVPLMVYWHSVSQLQAGQPVPEAAGRGSRVDDIGKGEHAARVNIPEIVSMLWAITSGSQMGPGDGWFHPGQSRYGWNWVTSRYRPDQKGIITRDQFTGPKEYFDRLDRTHDGVLTVDDFEGSNRSGSAAKSMPARLWFSQIDGDSNGQISREEWNAFFTKMAQGKDHVTPDDLQKAFPLSPPGRKAATPPRSNEGPSPVVLMKGLISGELGSFFEGPGIDEPAPDFTLRTQDGNRTVQLSQYRGTKPVVLVFGSFT
jgi:hypothetical protein